MKKILFVCLGNICRSPMAEFIFKDIVKKAGREGEYEIASAATSSEELGNPVYPPARAVLSAHGVPFDRRSASRVTEEQIASFDRVLCMDSGNLSTLLGRFPWAKEKIAMLGNFGGEGVIDDPWYTRDFERAFDEISRSCHALFGYLEENKA